MAKGIESQNFSQQKERKVDLADDRARVFLAETDIVGASGVDASYAEELKFMEDELVVRIHKTSNQNEDDPVMCGCNGVPARIFRGVPTKIKRKFVNSILASSLMRVETVEGTNERGEKTTYIKKFSGERYPLSIEFDPNPSKGRAWVEKAIRNGGS